MKAWFCIPWGLTHSSLQPRKAQTQFDAKRGQIRARRSLVAFALLFAFAQPALGINIILNFNSAASESPAFDPMLPGNQPPTGLQALMNYAEAYYQDVFEDNHTITINYWYEDLPGFIGQHTLVSQGNDPSCSMLTGPSPLCRETEANIRIDTRLGTGGALRNWFIDPTPTTSEEFNMQQTLWRDLSAANQIDWYVAGNPPIPPTFEVGFTGNAWDPMSPAGTATDMLSTVLHEVGHALGMSGSNNSSVAETLDGDYDFNPAFIFNRILAADTRDSASDTVGHLDNTLALMNGFSIGGGGLRMFPSHTDLFAMAAGHSYTALDVPRREFYGGTNFNLAGNWSGNNAPGSADTAFVRHGGTATLSANRTVGTLFIDENSTVNTGASQLTATGAIAVQQTSGPGVSSLSVPLGGRVNADLLFVNQLGTLVMTGGAVDVNELVIAPGGLITGNGTIDVTNAIGDVVNDGVIAATGGTLTLDSTNNIALDLDGVAEDGVVQAINGNLVFNTGLSESFNGNATVGAGRSMSFNGGVSIGAGGLLSLDGLPANGATVNGIVSIEQNGVLSGSGRGIVNAAVTLQSNGFISASDATTELRLNGSTNFSGGRIVGPGTVMQTGDAVVNADTTISVATYDMDGLGGNSTISVSAGRTFRIESTAIESTGGGDGYDGTLNINNGTVDIVIPWILEGIVNLNDTGPGSPLLTGAGGVTVNSGGRINVSGSGDVETSVSVNNGTIFVDGIAAFSGPTTLGVNANVEIDGAGDSLRLRGNTILIGPSLVGNGRLILEDTVNVAFVNTSIGTAETDLDGLLGNTEITIQSGLTLSIASTTIEPTANDGFDGTIHNRGTLSILAGWRLDGTLNMSPIGQNVATLDGVGGFEIHTTGILNSSGTSDVNPNATVAGAVRVSSGTLRMNGMAAFHSTAVVNIAAGSELELNGSSTFNAGSYSGAGTIQFNSNVAVNQSTAINVQIVDLDGISGNTAVTLNNSQLTLNADRVDLVNNRFDGTLNINGTLAGLTVNLSDPMDSWEMNGTLSTTGGFLLPQTTLQGSPVRITGTMNTDGIAQLFAPMDLSGTLTTADAATEVRLSFGPHVIRDTAVVSGPGTLVVNSNATLRVADDATIGIDTINRGRFEPGTSTGTAAIGGDFEQSSTGVLGIEIGGAPGTNQDRLNITGIADLAGELQVSAFADDPPSIGLSYTILTASSVVGTFDTFTLLSHPIFEYQATLGYPGTRVTLRFTDVSMFGDFNDDLMLDCVDVDALVAEIAAGGSASLFDLNGDSVVNLADLNLWLSEAGTFNVGGPYLGGDANLDGFVDVADFDIWNANRFTAVAGWCSGDFTADGVADVSDFGVWNVHKFTGSNSVTLVPEPTYGLFTILLLLLATGTTASRLAPSNSRLVIGARFSSCAASRRN